MKLKDLNSPEFNKAFQKFMALKGVPGGQLFKMKGIANKLKDEAKKFEEIRTEVIEEVSEKDEHGKKVMIDQTQVKIAVDKIDEANKRLKDLGDVEIELPEIKFSDLGKEPELTAEDLFHLEFIKE